MLSAKRKLRLLTAFTTLFMLALAVGCRGFFVNPKLTSITVTPVTPSLTLNQALQMTATGNFDDGSTKNLTGTSTWTSSANTQVSVNSTGLITALANTTSAVTITATNGTVSGSTTATVGQQTIVVAPANQTYSLSTNPGPHQYTATLNGTDVTATATWTSSNTSVATVVQSGTGAGQVTAVGVGTANITATTSNATGSTGVTVTN
ncbi:MAG: hypothetical protein AUH86_24730 [Acidobacteria bacterium 13_1_40CM_4_58_4]|nr:MAG: hypothetical protein AUH86_24730 [Acidobacteria bacterium 13_1_40CM_4_58_4]HLB88432.1 Ig-like domain-containing protein [Terriglobales bacterium]